MRIVALKPNNEQSIKQAAALLIEGFKIQSPDSWPTTTVALEEVKESLQPDRISRIAVDDKGNSSGMDWRHQPVTMGMSGSFSRWW